MYQDKLTQEQRVRLEAFAQVNQRTLALIATGRVTAPPSVETTIREAQAVVKFITGDADALGG
jgi:hypothetical protein